MSYKIAFTQTADEDFKVLTKTGDKATINKINQLLLELRDHPYTGIGKPKRLKHMHTNTFSRRINKKHRLVYTVYEEEILILILSMAGHYNDK